MILPDTQPASTDAPDVVRFVLVLRAEPPGRDRLGRLPVYRLRVLLKRLLRDTGLRCVSIQPGGAK